MGVSSRHCLYWLHSPRLRPLHHLSPQLGTVRGPESLSQLSDSARAFLKANEAGFRPCSEARPASVPGFHFTSLSTPLPHLTAPLPLRLPGKSPWSRHCPSTPDTYLTSDPITTQPYLACLILIPDLSSALGLQSEEPEGRSYSTLTTVREIETQTELLSPGSGRTEEEDDQDEGIKQAMNHFVQENGTLRAKPTGNGIYINGRGHLV